MRKAQPLIVLFGVAVAMSACLKDQDDAGYQAANITFKQDTGYTFMDDTLQMGDTIRIGVWVEQGSERLYTFAVTRSLNGDAGEQVLELPIDSVPFYHEQAWVLREQPGSERFSFMAIEGNGDITRRSLTFTTE